MDFIYFCELPLEVAIDDFLIIKIVLNHETQVLHITQCFGNEIQEILLLVYFTKHFAIFRICIYLGVNFFCITPTITIVKLIEFD